MRLNVLVAINVVGSSLSGLLLVSGILLYPLITFIFWFGMLGAAIAALFVGFWFGGYGRVRGGAALCVANAAVLLSFAMYVVPFVSSDVANVFLVAFSASALLTVFGYAAIAGVLTRPLFRAWSKQA